MPAKGSEGAGAPTSEARRAEDPRGSWRGLHGSHELLSVCRVGRGVGRGEAAPNKSSCGLVDRGPCPRCHRRASWGHTASALQSVGDTHHREPFCKWNIQLQKEEHTTVDFTVSMLSRDNTEQVG